MYVQDLCPSRYPQYCPVYMSPLSVVNHLLICWSFTSLILRAKFYPPSWILIITSSFFPIHLILFMAEVEIYMSPVVLGSGLLMVLGVTGFSKMDVFFGKLPNGLAPPPRPFLEITLRFFPENPLSMRKFAMKFFGLAMTPPLSPLFGNYIALFFSPKYTALKPTKSAM